MTHVSPNKRWVWVPQDDGNLVRKDMLGVYPDRGVADALGWPLDDRMPQPEPPPVGPVLNRAEGYGVSYYTAITDPDCVLSEWANRRRDVGSRHSRYWLVDAWANGRLETVAPGGIPGSMYEGFQPWHRMAAGWFDLTRINPLWLERVNEAIEEDHRTGQHPVLTVLELYTWSASKAGLVWVPTRNLQPTRNNAQQVKQGNPDDDAWYEHLLPSAVKDAYEMLMRELVALIGDRWDRVTIEVGNEHPQKSVHAWVRDTVRGAGWRGRIQINRNEDTPSQYDNMGVGQAIGYRGNVENGGYDSLAIHSQGTLAYLDHDYGPEQHKHRTFRALYDSGDIVPGSFVFSTDGIGDNSPPTFYDEDDLIAVSRDALGRGFAVEHQAREIKLGRFLQGRLDLNDLNTDLCLRMQPV